MLTKNVLKTGGAVGLLVFGILWAQIPVKAQEKALREQLAEAKAAIADQVWIIEQMKDNFFIGDLFNFSGLFGISCS